jgi:hypothetical protein
MRSLGLAAVLGLVGPAFAFLASPLSAPHRAPVTRARARGAAAMQVEIEQVSPRKMDGASSQKTRLLHHGGCFHQC